MLDMDILGAGLAELIRGEVGKALAPLNAEIAGLREALAQAEGGGATLEFVRGQIEELLAEVAMLQHRPDVAEVDAAIARAIAQIPPAKDGKDATPLDYWAVVREVQALVAPPEPGPKGDPGDPGRDGAGVASALINRDGALVLTLSDGATRELGPVVGRDGEASAPGKDGAPGRDGFGLEDFDSEVRDGGRTLVLKFEAGETLHTVEHQLDTMIYRGVFQAERETPYLPGDTVTWARSLWHCNAETRERPGEGNPQWTLAARAGRDGKDFDIEKVRGEIARLFAEAEARLGKRLDMAFARVSGL